MFLSVEKKDQKYWPGLQVNLQIQIKSSTYRLSKTVFISPFPILYHTLVQA